MKIPVLDTNKQVLEPCHPAKARRLLKSGQAAVWRRYPFTIILKRAVDNPETKEYQLCVDPGSKVTGVAIVDEDRQIVFAAELHHRADSIKKSLTTRAGFRRSRRSRKLRYRPARFLNRTKPKGWVAPSLMSRVHNTETITRRLCKLYPITNIALELVKFDTQLMDNPEIKGVQYQQGTLRGYEVREYLLEKHKRKCAYCSDKDTKLQVEHIIPKALGGTSRISNLTLSCEPCNQKKGKTHPDDIADPKLKKAVKSAMTKSNKTLKDAAAVNTIRWKIADVLKGLGLPIEYGSGGKTKFNRVKSGLPKTHYFDAACVANIVTKPLLPLLPLLPIVYIIKSKGYGTRDLFTFRAGENKNKVRLVGKEKAKKKKHGFVVGDRKRIAGDSYKKYDHVVMRKKSGAAYTGVINHFKSTPKKNAPRNISVESTDVKSKDPRMSGNTSEISLIQRRDGYYYSFACLPL